MAQWLIIAALATIGVTLVLIGVFYRVNRRLIERHREDVRRQRSDSGDGGGYVAPSGNSGRHDAEDGGGDGGGGD